MLQLTTWRVMTTFLIIACITDWMIHIRSNHLKPLIHLNLAQYMANQLKAIQDLPPGWFQLQTVSCNTQFCNIQGLINEPKHLEQLQARLHALYQCSLHSKKLQPHHSFSCQYTLS